MNKFSNVSLLRNLLYEIIKELTFEKCDQDSGAALWREHRESWERHYRWAHVGRPSRKVDVYCDMYLYIYIYVRIRIHCCLYTQDIFEGALSLAHMHKYALTL